MKCPRCSSNDTSVIEKRDVDDRSIRRRRKCVRCDFRFTTYEKFEQIKLTVTKRGGKRESFDKQKIVRGIKIAGKDRLSDEKIEEIADEIERKILEQKQDPISSKKIGQIVIDCLKGADQIAYLRFASVYKNFKNLSSFEQELSKLKK